MDAVRDWRRLYLGILISIWGIDLALVLGHKALWIIGPVLLIGGMVESVFGLRTIWRQVRDSYGPQGDFDKLKAHATLQTLRYLIYISIAATAVLLIAKWHYPELGLVDSLTN